MKSHAKFGLFAHQHRQSRMLARRIDSHNTIFAFQQHPFDLTLREPIERAFAHIYDTGGMRRTHLRGHSNILKRLLLHAGGFNLGLLMRHLIGVGTPRGLQGRLAAILALIVTLWTRIVDLWRAGLTPAADRSSAFTPDHRFERLSARAKRAL